VPDLQYQEREVTRFYRRGVFNPGSSKQILDYIRGTGGKVGRNRKTGSDSADRTTIERLVKSGDPLYPKILEFRNLEKLRGTYIQGILNRLDRNSRVHGRFTHRPSTMRLSSADPNLQNLTGDEEDELVQEFRRTIVAAPGCKLIDADFQGIEAVDTGWCMGDPTYMRLALLGIHDYVTSHVIGQPASLSWSDSDLRGYLGEMKSKHKRIRGQCKRVVHETNYGATPRGMQANDPDIFPSIRAAEEVQEMYFALCPKLKPWQLQTKELAARQGYLGGPGHHPFGYIHWYWNVKKYDQIHSMAQKQALEQKGIPVIQIGGKWYSVHWGDDAKRAVSFFPQSIAAGTIYEAMLELFDPDNPISSYIGDLYHGGIPLRAQVHDSLLLEAPDDKVDQAIAALQAAMRRPIEEQPCPPEWNMGTHLKLGVSIKVGSNWCEADMEKVA
jgi:hypothetical protein